MHQIVLSIERFCHNDLLLGAACYMSSLRVKLSCEQVENLYEARLCGAVLRYSYFHNVLKVFLVLLSGRSNHQIRGL